MFENKYTVVAIAYNGMYESSGERFYTVMVVNHQQIFDSFIKPSLSDESKEAYELNDLDEYDPEDDIYMFVYTLAEEYTKGIEGSDFDFDQHTYDITELTLEEVHYLYKIREGDYDDAFEYVDVINVPGYGKVKPKSAFEDVFAPIVAKKTTVIQFDYEPSNIKKEFYKTVQ